MMTARAVTEAMIDAALKAEWECTGNGRQKMQAALSAADKARLEDWGYLPSPPESKT